MLWFAVAIHRPPRNFSVDLSFLTVHILIGHLDALEADRAWTNAYFCQHYAFWFGELPPCCILNHFDAFRPIVFASLCDNGPAQRWRVIVRERETVQLQESDGCCTAAPLSPHTTTHWRSIMKQCPAPRLPPLPQLQHQQLEQPLLWYNSLLVRL